MCENYGRGDCFNCYLIRRLRQRTIRLEGQKVLLLARVKKMQRQMKQNKTENIVELE